MQQPLAQLAAAARAYLQARTELDAADHRVHELIVACYVDGDEWATAEAALTSAESAEAQALAHLASALATHDAAQDGPYLELDGVRFPIAQAIAHHALHAERERARNTRLRLAFDAESV